MALSPRAAIALEQSVVRLSQLLLREAGPGLSHTSGSVLGHLRRDGPQRVTDLAAMESLAQPSMTAVVNRLVDEGLVEREADPSDGRAVLVTITDRGRARLRARQSARAAALQQRLARLDEEERALLERAVPLLERLTRDR